jgi:hypothetical protein
MEGPYDVAKTEEIRTLLDEWDIEETEKLIKTREVSEKHTYIRKYTYLLHTTVYVELLLLVRAPIHSPGD